MRTGKPQALQPLDLPGGTQQLAESEPIAELDQDGAIVAGDPEFGERVEPAPANPARKTAPKKTDD